MPIWLLRVLFVLGMLASPIVALIYLLLAISIPSEERLAAELMVEVPAASQRERFEQRSKVLFDRLIGKGSARAWSPQVVAILLLVLAAALELPRVEGDSFFYLHPVLTTVYSDLSEKGSALFYLALAVTMFISWNASRPVVRIEHRTESAFDTESDTTRMIAGVASAIGQRTGIDPAYVRALLLMLNIFTMGIAGAVYILLAVYLRRRQAIASGPQARSAIMEQTPQANSIGIRYALGGLFLFSVLLQVATQYRLFFFNEVFANGLILAIIGIILVLAGMRSPRQSASLLLIGGSTVFFAGVYLFALAVGRIQVTVAAEFEIVEIIGTLALLYYSLSTLEGEGRKLALSLAASMVLGAILIHVHVVPLRYLVAIAQFYSFFFPVIFAGLGLWITFER